MHLGVGNEPGTVGPRGEAEEEEGGEQRRGGALHRACEHLGALRRQVGELQRRLRRRRLGALGSGGSRASVTHQTASWQPSPAGIGVGSTQPRSPFGQVRRTWKWSWWSHHGRTLRSQAVSRRVGGRRRARA